MMKFNLIKPLLPGCIGLLLLAWPVATSASPEDGCGEALGEGLKVELDFAAQPVQTGGNEVVVTLHDAAGKPICAAEVTVIAAELLPADLAEQPEAEVDSHTSDHDMADMAEQSEAEADRHASDHDMEGLAEQAGTEVDSHTSEHDMADMAEHPEAETDSHTSEHDMADMTEHPEAEADSHTSEYDMADMAEHPEAETDSHTSDHDMAEQPEAEADSHQSAGGHSGGHSEAAPAGLTAAATPGEYQGEVNFTTEGRWLVKVNVLAHDQSQEVEFTVGVIKRDPNWYVLSGFLSVNVLVIATAGVMKQRAAKVKPEQR